MIHRATSNGVPRFRFARCGRTRKRSLHLPIASERNLTKVPHFQRSRHDFSCPRYSQIRCHPFHGLRGVGLLFAFFLIKAVIRLSPGNDRMRQIAGAIEEGAKAYLKRQVVTISAIAAVIFVLLFIFRDKSTALGFLIGAFCSLAAGYIGMRIAVLANTRTTQAASQSRIRRDACRFQRRRRHRPSCCRSRLIVGRNFLHARQNIGLALTWP